jgi:pullulanase-like protein
MVPGNDPGNVLEGECGCETAEITCTQPIGWLYNQRSSCPKNLLPKMEAIMKLAHQVWLCAAMALLISVSIAASSAANPTSVTIAGSMQSEAGCSGDWDPGCPATHLTYDVSDDVWQGTWFIPTGSYEYKAAIDDNWNENYGLNGIPGGANIPLNLAAGASVKFYYDHKSHWVTDNHSSIIATVPGSFQHTLGCPGDWAPDCLRSWLQDEDGDGVMSFATTSIPPGNYEAKVAINESWDENYGQGGVPGGPNIPFTVAHDGAKVTFSYDSTTHVLTIGIDDPLPALQRSWGGVKATYR